MDEREEIEDDAFRLEANKAWMAIIKNLNEVAANAHAALETVNPSDAVAIARHQTRLEACRAFHSYYRGLKGNSPRRGNNERRTR